MTEDISDSVTINDDRVVFDVLLYHYFLQHQKFCELLVGGGENSSRPGNGELYFRLFRLH